jgi:hypothetical protein
MSPLLTAVWTSVVTKIQRHCHNSTMSALRNLPSASRGKLRLWKWERSLYIVNDVAADEGNFRGRRRRIARHTSLPSHNPLTLHRTKEAILKKWSWTKTAPSSIRNEWGATSEDRDIYTPYCDRTSTFDSKRTGTEEYSNVDAMAPFTIANCIAYCGHSRCQSCIWRTAVSRPSSP